MTAGLLAKTALFPLHLWLPAAHGGASAAVSALLSALVVKAAFVVLLRLWFGAAPGLLPAVAPLLAALGGAAIVVGSLVAVRQARLKLLVAYSTVAQLGYLFLVFPLVVGDHPRARRLRLDRRRCCRRSATPSPRRRWPWRRGCCAAAYGHDRMDGLGGAARAMPVTVIAFGLAGLSLMGMPPSGGFVAKWLLLRRRGRKRAMVVVAGHRHRRAADRRLCLPRAGGGAGPGRRRRHRRARQRCRGGRRSPSPSR